jgi:four helix bundle protein
MPWALGNEGSRTRKEKSKMQEQRGGFYTLAAWQRGDDLAVKIYTVTQKFPRYELYGLTSQLRRAAVSVPANIAEGSGRRTIRDYIRFLYNAKGSLAELEYLIHLSHRLEYITDEEFQKLRQHLRRTAGSLLGFIRFKEDESRTQPE